MAPLLRDLLGTLADPMVLIQVEITGEHGPVNHGVVVGQEAVISHDGWPGEEESEYVSIEPNTLVWELARKVNLHRGEKPEEGAPEVRVETTMGALDAAFVALEEPGRTMPLHANSYARRSSRRTQTSRTRPSASSWTWSSPSTPPGVSRPPGTASTTARRPP